MVLLQPLQPSLSNLFGPNESGDPIVLYDSEADRYIVSSMGSSALNFAVSVSNDPVNDGWHVYNAASNQFPTWFSRLPKVFYLVRWILL